MISLFVDYIPTSGTSHLLAVSSRSRIASSTRSRATPRLLRCSPTAPWQARRKVSRQLHQPNGMAPVPGAALPAPTDPTTGSLAEPVVP